MDRLFAALSAGETPAVPVYGAARILGGGVEWIGCSLCSVRARRPRSQCTGRRVSGKVEWNGSVVRCAQCGRDARGPSIDARGPSKEARGPSIDARG
jgi:hypothetical protein